jgi:DNA-binding LacI/PurR family transcriptional regulator
VVATAKTSSEPRAAEARTPARKGPGRRRAIGHVKDKPTIRVVAERARVAVSTVSRVLNGGYASDDVKTRVRSAIEELAYSPSITAQSLVTGRTGCIGVVVSSTQSTWFSQILAGIEEQLAHSRQSVLLASLVVDGRYDSAAVAAWISEHRVDGLIFIRYTRKESQLFSAAKRAGLPVVLIGPDVTAPGGLIVRCNNLEGGRLVGQHLHSLGHERIAFAGGPRDSLDSRDRLAGLRKELSLHGVEIRARDVWFGPSYAPEAGMEYAEHFLAQRGGGRATAVAMGNDAMAMGFMRTLLQRGVQVPKDVSVIGFDGIPEGGLYWPGVTTVVQPVRRMGASGCRALLDSMSNPDQDRVTAVEYGVELLVRESTGRAGE